MYKTDKEIADTIDKLHSYMDAVLHNTNDNSIVHFYCTGGTARRLFMLENDIPLNENDWDSLWVSDIDVHGRVTDVFSAMTGFNDFGIDEKPLSDFIKQPEHNMKVQRIKIDVRMPFDISSQIRKKHKLKNFFTFSSNAIEKYLVDNIIPEEIGLPYDLESCKFVYYNGKVYDLRNPDLKNDDFFADYTQIEDASIRSLGRLIKYEKFGFYYSEENIKDFFSAITYQKGDMYGHSENGIKVNFNKVKGV